MVVTDSTGREYNVGDYVYCAVLYNNGKVLPYVGRVINVGKRAVTVVAETQSSYRDFIKSTLQKPENHLIIPAEIALLKSPKLQDFKLPEFEPKLDALGREYKIGDYVYCAQHYSTASVRTFFGRVCKINPCSIKVMRKGWRDNFYAATLLVPCRHLIVPAEVALTKDPALADVVFE